MYVITLYIPEITIKCIFLKGKFEEHLCSEMYFSREQFI